MGPLVYYCRWREAKLRLRGREEPFVWGDLAFSDSAGGSSRIEPFRFNTMTWELFLQRADGWTKLQLDELGVVEAETDLPEEAAPTTSAGASPQ